MKSEHHSRAMLVSAVASAANLRLSYFPEG